MHPSRPLALASRHLPSLALGLLGGLGVVAAERLLAPPPRVATVDSAAIVAERVSEVDVGSLPESSRIEDAARFAGRLEAAVAELAEEHGALLIAAGAVVAGAPDLTPVLRARLGPASPTRRTPRAAP